MLANIKKAVKKSKYFTIKRILIAVIILAFILRFSALVLLNTPDSLTNKWAATDSIVSNLLEGKGFTWDGQNPDFLIFPAHVFFLVFIRYLGFSYFFAKIIQCFMGAITCLVIYHIGKRAFNRGIGLLGAFLWSIFPYSVVHAQALEDATMMVLFTSLSILLSIMLLEKRHLTTSIILGLVCGITVMIRSTFMSFMVILLPWLLTHLKLRYSYYVAVVAVCSFLVICPWVIRNYIHTGQITMIANGGLALWTGNNPYTNSMLKANLNQDYIQKKKDFFIPGTSLKKINLEKDRLYRKMALDFIKSNPAEFAENVLLKLYYFYGWKYYFRQTDGPVGRGEITLSSENIEDLKAESEVVYSQPLKRVRSIIYSYSAFPLFLMALAGFFICRPIWESNRQIIILFILFFTSAHILTIANIRHREPINALLTLYASGFILWSIEKIRMILDRRNSLIVESN